MVECSSKKVSLSRMLFLVLVVGLVVIYVSLSSTILPGSCHHDEHVPTGHHDLQKRSDNVWDPLRDTDQPPVDSIERRRNCPLDYQLNASFLRYYDKAKQESNYNANESDIHRSRVVILTPVSNSAKHIHHFLSLICTLSYPHDLISVVFGEDSSRDKTYELASIRVKQLQSYFHRIEVHHLNISINSIPFSSRHDPDWQRVRRSHLAKARNQLLFRGLRDEEWVLWIDSDVNYFPPDLIQHLLSAQANVTVPSCLYYGSGGQPKVYDRNTWQETKQSLAFIKSKTENYLMLEGYSVTLRKYLPDLTGEGAVVSVDGVGGCVLLISSHAHRNGLIFPSFIYKNHIETEGLAKMAAAIGLSIKGLPNVSVFHV